MCKLKKKPNTLTRTVITIAILALILLASCRSSLNNQGNGEYMATEAPTKQIQQGKYNWPDPEDYTPLSFLDEIRNGEPADTLLRVLTMIDKFPIDWVKRTDIDTLMTLIQTTERCACFLNPLSSYIPTDDYAEVGGFARLFIQSYKENQRLDLGLHNCPKVDKTENAELIRWWIKEK